MHSMKKIIYIDGEDWDASELDGGWDYDDTRNVNHRSESEDPEEAFDKFVASKTKRGQ